MKLNNLKPIFIQVAEWTEDEILKDNIKEGDKIFSFAEFAKAFDINPITAGKGVSLLESRGIVEKKRGVGMFVTPNAKSMIYEYRKNESLVNLIDDMIVEMKALNITYKHLLELIGKRKELHDNNEET